MYFSIQIHVHIPLITNEELFLLWHTYYLKDIKPLCKHRLLWCMRWVAKKHLEFLTSLVVRVDTKLLLSSHEKLSTGWLAF